MARGNLSAKTILRLWGQRSSGKTKKEAQISSNVVL
jgi:hypothetical protein